MLSISLNRWMIENFNLKSKSYWLLKLECILIGDFLHNPFNVFLCWYFISTTCFRPCGALPYDVSFNIHKRLMLISHELVSTSKIATTFQFTVEREKKCGKRPFDTWINKQYLLWNTFHIQWMLVSTINNCTYKIHQKTLHTHKRNKMRNNWENLFDTSDPNNITLKCQSNI